MQNQNTENPTEPRKSRVLPSVYLILNLTEIVLKIPPRYHWSSREFLRRYVLTKDETIRPILITLMPRYQIERDIISLQIFCFSWGRCWSVGFQPDVDTDNQVLEKDSLPCINRKCLADQPYYYADDIDERLISRVPWFFQPPIPLTQMDTLPDLGYPVWELLHTLPFVSVSQKTWTHSFPYSFINLHSTSMVSLAFRNLQNRKVSWRKP